VAEPDDAVGSLGQETIKLLRSTHVCTTGWCPICQVVGYVHDHPELVEQVTETVTDAAIQVGRVIRDFLDKTMPPESE
jgi:hypothetical protein